MEKFFCVSNIMMPGYHNIGIPKDLTARNVLLGVILYLHYNKLNLVRSAGKTFICEEYVNSNSEDLSEKLGIKDSETASLIDNERIYLAINDIIVKVIEKNRRNKVVYDYDKELYDAVVMSSKAVITQLHGKAS